MSRHDLDARKDADILQALGGLGDVPRFDERSDADLVAGAMAGFADPRYAPIEPEPVPVLPERPQASQAPVIIAVATAALAIAAAVVVLLVRPGGLLSEQSNDTAGNLAPDVRDDEAEEFEAVPGKASKRRKRAAAQLPAAPADEEPADVLPSDCNEVARGVAVCPEEGAGVTSQANTGPGPARVQLDRGRVRVIAAADGESVVVTAGDIQITGRGTVFDATLVLSPSSDGNVLIVVVSSGFVTVRQTGATPTRVGPGDPFVLAIADDSDETGDDAEDSGDETPRPRPKRKTTPNDLLTQAQKLFGAGKTKQAVRVYETLVSRHPGTAAGKAARVSLGRIELGQGHAKQALKHFDAYLAASAGSLVEEARYGRIRALRKLGRSGQERRSIDAFLADYPKSIYAARLKKRASELQP